MNAIHIRRIVVAALLVGGASLALANSNGPPAASTGAPAIGGKAAEVDCTDCHTGNALNTGGSIALTGAPAYYTPGQVYIITVNVASSQTAAITDRLWGFQLTAVKVSDGTGAGTFANVTGQNTRIRTGSGDFSTRSYIEQSGTGLQMNVASPVSWQIQWTAPAAATGSVIFSFAGMAADGVNGESGDWVYTGSFSSKDVTPARQTTWGQLKSAYR